MMSRRIVVILVILSMFAVLLTGCGGQPAATGAADSQDSAPPPSASSSAPNPEGSKPPEDTTKFAEHIEVISDSTAIAVINPFAAAGTGNSTNWVYAMIYDTLVKTDDDGNVLPCLATSWETEDFQTYTFYLRDDVVWHNGDKFTANDVINTWQMALEAGGGFPCWTYWNRIESATAIDDYTLEVVLKTVNVDFYYGLGVMYCGIVNKAAVEADPENGYWIGTGAYKVTDFSSKDFVSFERNDDYWGELAITKTQTWKYIPEMTTRTIMLQNGEADICFETSESDISVFSGDPNFTVHLAGGLNPFSLMMNQDDPLMADENFRYAVLYALDREEVAIFANGELALQCPDGAVWQYGMRHRNTDIPLITQDQEKAKEYLAASSYNGEEVVLTTAINYNIKAAEAIQEQLGKVGINVTIDQMDITGFVSATTWANNTTHMNIWCNLLGASPFGFVNNFGISAAHNRSKLQNDELQAILDSVYSMTDEDERDAAWKRAQEIVFEENTCIPFSYRLSAIVCKSSVDGMTMPGNLLCDLRYMYMIES